MTAMNELKNALISPPVLALPNFTGHITLDTDACNVQVGRVLLQKQRDETVRPVGSWSRALNDTKKQYDTTHRKCLAIVWSVLVLRPYLKINRSTIRTGRDSLKWILNLSDSTGRFARWRLCLSEFEFDVVHKAGVKHQAADALSRLPATGADT